MTELTLIMGVKYSSPSLWIGRWRRNSTSKTILMKSKMDMLIESFHNAHILFCMNTNQSAVSHTSDTVPRDIITPSSIYHRCLVEQEFPNTLRSLLLCQIGWINVNNKIWFFHIDVNIFLIFISSIFFSYWLYVCLK